MNLVHHYDPRTHFLPFHQAEKRWAILLCHRRMGKTVASINHQVARATYTKKKNARFAYIAPFYGQAKDVVWAYLKEATRELDVEVRESELSVTFKHNGARIRLYGADNDTAIRGIYLDGVILDEFGEMAPNFWGEVIFPTLTDRGGWAVFIGTVKGKNHFWRMYEKALDDPDWYTLLAPLSKTKILAESEIRIIKQNMSDDQYRQEFECDPYAAISGAYYSRYILSAETDGRVQRGLWQPDLPVHCALDIGRRDATGIWHWQDRPDGCALLAYDEFKNQDIDYLYASVLMVRPWFDNYGTIWLPHDAKAKTLATKRSTVEQLVDLGLKCVVQPLLAVQHGIEAARMMLPRCYFEEAETVYGRECLRQYHAKWNEKKQLDGEPDHDWSSHCADAFRGFALVARGGEMPTAEVPKPKNFNSPPTFTLDALYEDRTRARSKYGTRIH